MRVLIDTNVVLDFLQYACAVAYSVDAIVTRDASGFTNAEIPVVLPEGIGSF